MEQAWVFKEWLGTLALEWRNSLFLTLQQPFGWIRGHSSIWPVRKKWDNQDFLSRFPDSEYAPNAHYWLGQLLFNKQQWTEAKEQFSIVNERFVDSAKRPDALLKLGVIAERQGNDALAKQLFNQVVNDFPSSSARKLAEAKLNN